MPAASPTQSTFNFGQNACGPVGCKGKNWNPIRWYTLTCQRTFYEIKNAVLFAIIFTIVFTALLR